MILKVRALKCKLVKHFLLPFSEREVVCERSEQTLHAWKKEPGGLGAGRAPRGEDVYLLIHKNSNSMNEEKQVRKKSPKHGRTQTRTTFVIDNDIWEHLQKCPNKSRLINDLLRAYYCLISHEDDSK